MHLLKPLASLKLTIIIFVASLILILAGTLAQVDRGLWAVLEDYFRSWYVAIPLELFALFLPGEFELPGVLPWPGGATIGLLLLVNLIAAHGVRFKISAKGAKKWIGTVWIAVGVVAIWAAFFVPPITNALAENIVLMFALGSLFFIPLLVGCAILFGNRMGIVLIHASLITLLIGEGVTAVKALETQMPIYEGQDQAIDWAQDVRETELAIIDPADPNNEQVWAVRQKALMRAAETGETLRAEGMPFGIKVERWVTNGIVQPTGPMDTRPAPATHGLAQTDRYRLFEQKESSGATAGSDFNAAIVRIIGDNNTDLGQYLVSVLMQEQIQRGLTHRFLRQAVTVGEDKTYDISLRFRRYQKAYAVALEDFRHDLYPGTNTPKNFSSDIILSDAGAGVERPAHIKMNEPLRYAGETFFQASWLPDDSGTVLQVVRNPGWTIPYISCIVGGLGLTVHFVLSLMKFGGKERKRAKKAASQALAETSTPGSTELNAPLGKDRGLIGWVPALVLGLVFGAYCLMGLAKQPSTQDFNGYDIPGFGQLVVANDGRFKPLDSVARDTLLTISGKSKIKEALSTAERHPSWLEHEDKPAIAWLLDTWASPTSTENDYVFRIDHGDIKHLIGVDDAKRKLFSRDEIAAHIDAIQDQAKQTSAVDKRDRSPYQRGIIELLGHLNVYAAVASQRTFQVPPASTEGGTPITDAKQSSENWRALAAVFAHSPTDPIAQGYAKALSAYASQDPAGFNSAVTDLLVLQRKQYPDLNSRMSLEQGFNGYAPFTKAIAIFIVATLCVLGAWMGFTKPLLRAAVVLVLIGFIVETAALGIRIHLSGRPPVTNLYSSAVFIGWAAVGLGLLLERFVGFGFGLLVSTISGIATLLVAKGLETGDTMNVLQAVLDTNFWLATHVITITLGYSATFIAMLFGILYIFAGLFTPALRNAQLAKRLTGLIYGTTCFALLLSFVGTILGGIWADQSWGRFWGWDPKENGALLIVIWTALILHARWGGLVKARGLAVLATLGGMVTVWSWFGTNLLGAGLHSYGFMEGAFFWVRASFLALIVIAAFASVPTKDWMSFRVATPKKPVSE